MIKLFREYRFYTTLALLILIPILSLNTSSKSPEEFSLSDRVISAVTSPAQSAVSFSMEKVASLFEHYIFLRNTKFENAAILEENRKLLNTIHSMREIEIENQRLRSLLAFQSSIEERKVTAQVIAKDVTSEFRSIRINKGSSEGIQKGMPVVTHEGIVGKVLRTSSHFSDIITILDNLSSVDAMIQRTRARGVLEGLSDTTCVLKYVLRTDDIETGDQIISSGLDGIFPKGLLLGRVSKVNRRSYGITQDVEVKTSVDFSKLEEVLVIVKPDTALAHSAEP